MRVVTRARFTKLDKQVCGHKLETDLVGVANYVLSIYHCTDLITHT